MSADSLGGLRDKLGDEPSVKSYFLACFFPPYWVCVATRPAEHTGFRKSA